MPMDRLQDIVAYIPTATTHLFLLNKLERVLLKACFGQVCEVPLWEWAQSILICSGAVLTVG